MAGDERRLLEIAASVSDGSPVDWEVAALAAENEREKRALKQLRFLAAVGRISGSGGSAHEQVSPGARPEDLTETLASRDVPLAAAPPARWGHIEIRGVAGRGAFGEVYRAWDTVLDREVALKLLRAEEGAASGDAARELSRILPEGRLLARVRHPNVVGVFGADVHDGRAGIWMEFVRGATLEDLLSQRGPFGPEEAALIGRDLCRALSAVHGLGLVHRDVKTRNVMREEGGRIVLMDFGLGSAAPGGARGAPQSPAGTPLFMAPELLRGAPHTPGSDLYALGAILYRLVTGRYPVEGESPAAIAASHAEGRVPPIRDLRPVLPESFVRVVERLLAQDPAERFASAGEVERALAAASASGPSTDSAPSAVGLPAPAQRSSSRRLLIGAFAAAAVIAGFALSRPLRALILPGGPAYAIDAAFHRATPGGSERLDAGSRVAPGDEIYLELHGSRSLYAYVFNEDDLGNAYLLFPLPGYELTNPLPADKTLKLPGRRDGVDVRWQVTSAGGREHFLVVTSPRPLTELEAELQSLPRPQDGHAVDASPVDPESVKRMRGILRGVGGLKESPDAPERPATHLADLARRLGKREETARGVWMRWIDLENPGS